MTDQSLPVAPTCYRHADRVSYINCTRCARPMCPDCMVPAPVGFQCPSCVSDAVSTRVTPKTITGAQPITKPTFTYTLIGINVLVFGLQFLGGINEVAGNWGMWPVGIAVGGEWWRLFTAAFLHGSILHIAFNMYVLFVLGPTLERVLGHARYLILYLLAALGGGVASYIFSDMRTVSVGASGAIFGLMGALIVAGRRLKYDIKQVVLLLAVNVVIGFMAPGVDWRAHLGGLVTGAAVAAVFVLPPRAHRVLWQTVGIIAVLGVLLVLTVWQTAQILDFVAPFGVTINA